MKTLCFLLSAFVFTIVTGCGHDAEYPSPVSTTNNNTVPIDDSSKKPLIKDRIDSLAGVYKGMVITKYYYEGNLISDTTYTDSLKIIKSDIYTFFVAGSIYGDTVKHYYRTDNTYISHQQRMVLYIYPIRDSVYISYIISGHVGTTNTTFSGSK